MALPRDIEVIYGVNPVLEALRSGESPLERLLVARGRSGAVLEPVLRLAEERGIALSWLTPEEWRGLSELVEPDVSAVFSHERSADRRRARGGTGAEAVREQLRRARATLEASNRATRGSRDAG